MATDLLCTWILEYKKELPQPSNPKCVKLEYDNGFINLIVADIDAYAAKRKKSVKKTLTIPEWLNEMSEKENINFSQVLQTALYKFYYQNTNANKLNLIGYVFFSKLLKFIRAGAKKTPSSKGGDELAVFPALIMLKIVIIYAIIN